MRFTSEKDYATIVKINRELVNIVADTNVVLYKLQQEQTTTNSYGEATSKIWYKGVLIPGLINLLNNTATENMGTVDIEQQVTVSFLREECRSRNVYPESGDIVDWNDSYFEIHQVNEIQLYAGQTAYNHSIVCEAHLTRKTNLQLERPNV